MIQIPEITTARLRLRAPSVSDHARELEFYSSDHAHFVGGQKGPYDTWSTIVSRIGHWAVRGYGFWHLDELETGRYVGRCGCLMPYGWPEPEIGWSLMPDATGKGYATEAARAARAHAYDVLGWKTAISLIDPANPPSQGVAERLGCSYEGPIEHVEFGPMHVWRHPAPEDLK
jgi:RimJ/RimL family protein N-acetyltransferase